MTHDVDDIPWGEPPEPRVETAVPRRCRHPRWKRTRTEGGWTCECGHVADPVVLRRNRNNRSRGGRHELAAARRYGGEKTGPLGGAEDIRGRFWKTQVKTRQGIAPTMWRTAFAGMEAQRDGRVPRILVRFTKAGIDSDDYFIVRGRDWLDAFGRDEDEAA